MRRKTEKKARRSACGQAGTGPAAPDKQKGTTPEAAAPAEEEPAGEEEADQPEEPEPEEPGETETPEETENPEEDPSPDEVIAALEEQLLDARCRLAAFAAGVAPDLVADAVTLAVQAARAEGEVTEESVVAAMEQVLQRHPGWKADARRTGGFRLGADPAAARRQDKTPGTAKRWNRFR